MESETRALLAAWENFNVIVGSSGAALTGLQFVVIALISETPGHGSSREIRAFGTPTIVHFGAVLFIAAILSAPWERLSSVSLALTCCGIAGTVYGVITLRRVRRTEYQPVMEDWIWFILLPLIAYVAVFVSALLFRSFPRRMLFIISGAMLLLLFIGIHNAWDTVTYLAVGIKEDRVEQQNSADQQDESKSK